jgi:hypothetical protein
VAPPAVTHDVAPLVWFVTSHVSFGPHPHWGTRPQRLFGATVLHTAAVSGTLASAPFVSVVLRLPFAGGVVLFGCVSAFEPLPRSSFGTDGAEHATSATKLAPSATKSITRVLRRRR